MDFLKKNYEKILLALVLLGLTAAVGFLTIYIPEQKQKLDDMRNVVKVTNPQPLPPLDTKVEDEALKRLGAPYRLDLVSKHRVFNPVLWQIGADGHLRKIESPDQYGAGGVRIVSINPLYLTVAYVTNLAGGYQIKVKNEADLRPTDRTEVVHPSAAPTDRFILKKAEGSTENPTALVLEFNRDPSHETFTLKADPDQAFKKVVAYSADLKYRPDASLHWEKVRANLPGNLSFLPIEGERYKVIDVESNSVTISAPNNKRTTISLSRPTE